MTLRISEDLELPDQAVTETFAILAKRGMGKTNTAVVMAEEMIAGGHQVLAVDPTGVWWGLRSSADGRRPGLPVVILGGEHADVALEPTSGELVADLAVDENVSCVLDLSLMRKAQQIRFFTNLPNASTTATAKRCTYSSTKPMSSARNAHRRAPSGRWGRPRTSCDGAGPVASASPSSASGARC